MALWMTSSTNISNEVRGEAFSEGGVASDRFPAVEQQLPGKVRDYGTNVDIVLPFGTHTDVQFEPIAGLH